VGALLPAHAVRAAPAGLLSWAPVTLSTVPRWAPVVLSGDPSDGPTLGLSANTATTLTTALSGLPAILLLTGLFATCYAHRAGRPALPAAERRSSLDAPGARQSASATRRLPDAAGQPVRRAAPPGGPLSWAWPRGRSP
jgi:hypothetical protein